MNPTDNQNPIRSKKQLLISCAVATMVAIAILLVAVLPAEYSLDPLGTGKALGLMGLSEKESTALQLQENPWKTDSFKFELAPFEALEYKYRLEQDQAMIYSWTADGEALYEMHSEPDDAPKGFAETFAKGRGQQNNGVYRAPFSGIHGWYWQNRGSKPVIIHLDSSGFYSYAIEFRGGHETRKELSTN